MSEHDEARRAFLIKTAVGVGAATAGSLLPAAESTAQTPAKPAAMAMSMPPAQGQPSGPTHRGGDNTNAFFNNADAKTIDAMAERIFPGAPDMPGAHEADVLNYIDLALAGAYSDQQLFYRAALAQLAAYCDATYKKEFYALTNAQQDEVITALEKGTATGFDWPKAQDFFNAFRVHVIEGMFADPVYGGNKNFAGWRLVGFPGLQETYTAEDLASSEKYTRMPIIGMQS